MQDEAAPGLGDPQVAEALFGAVRCDALAPRGRALLYARPDEPIQEAVNRLWWNKVGSLPVIEAGELLGGFSEEDLLRVLGERLRQGEPGHTRIWSDLLPGLTVADVMTPAESLPVLEPETPLLDGLHVSCGPGMPQGRYLYVRTGGDDPVSVVSYRDVSRFLIQLHDGEPAEHHFQDAAAAEGACEAATQALGISIADARLRGLGHKPNSIGLRASGTEIASALVAGGRGYVLAVLADGEPYGICTRRDLLRVCVRRFANLDQIRLGSLMTHRVRTVSDANTLAGLFRLMALASCRHMPVVDEWDRVDCVISLWECVAGMAGAAPHPSG